MGGICGILGEQNQDIDQMVDDLFWTGDEQQVSYSDNNTSIHAVYRPGFGSDQPVEVHNDTLVWVYGEIYGFEDGNGYHRRERDAQETLAEYCARHYKKHGIEFVSQLNGTFVGIIYDSHDQTVSLFTDRIASRDIYYTILDGTLLFSSRLQSLALYPDYRPSFDIPYLTEYFLHMRSFGITTPFQNAYTLPPASISAFNLNSNKLRTKQYWYPRYRPLRKSFTYFVNEFTKRFQTALEERIGDEKVGLLLSGGSDSRLLLAGMDTENVTAYHLTNWMSREARIAERVAHTAGVKFEVLKRDQDYYERAFYRNPKMFNFAGRFEQAFAEGFMDQLRNEVDAILTGHFADTMFKGFHIPASSFPPAPFNLIYRHPQVLNSVDEYIERLTAAPPPYLKPSFSVRDILKNNIYEEDNAIQHHGISYRSLRDIIMSRPLYPAKDGSDPFFQQSLRENLPHRTPLADNRLIDLYLNIPRKQLLTKDIINSSIKRLNPKIADIPHAATSVPVKYPPPLQRVGRRITPKWLSIVDPPPSDLLIHHPWENYAELNKQCEFIRDAIIESEEIIRSLPFLSWDGVWECYEKRYLTNELNALLSVLQMPITEQIVTSQNNH